MAIFEMKDLNKKQLGFYQVLEGVVVVIVW
jgi:hypothetical protein